MCWKSTGLPAVVKQNSMQSQDIMFRVCVGNELICVKISGGKYKIYVVQYLFCCFLCTKLSPFSPSHRSWVCFVKTVLLTFNSEQSTQSSLNFPNTWPKSNNTKVNKIWMLISVLVVVVSDTCSYANITQETLIKQIARPS